MLWFLYLKLEFYVKKIVLKLIWNNYRGKCISIVIELENILCDICNIIYIGIVYKEEDSGIVLLIEIVKVVELMIGGCVFNGVMVIFIGIEVFLKLYIYKIYYVLR